jgi:hypothetical protein
MEDVLGPGADVEELPGVRGRGTVRWLATELERSSSAPGWAREAWLPITVRSGKWQRAERKSEGAVVAVTAGTTQPGPAKGPYFIDAYR